MKARITSILYCSVLLLGSCSDESVGPAVSDNPRSRTRKDHAIELLQLGYNSMSYDDIDELLHSDFVFYFSNADIDQGNVTLSQWDRPVELDATKKLFEQRSANSSVRLGETAVENVTWGLIKFVFSNRSASDPPTESIELEIVHDSGDENWTFVDHHEYFLSEPAVHESDWTKDISYTITVRHGDTVYTTETPLHARLTIRLGLTLRYRLIEWRDGI